MHDDARGFTLIELLIVVVIIGVLAAIAIPKFANTKEQAYLSTMKADLRNLATAQEAYQYDFSTYYGGAIPGVQMQYNPSTGVAMALTGVSASGWGATSTHVGTTKTCAIFIGNLAPVPPATVEGEPFCQ